MRKLNSIFVIALLFALLLGGCAESNLSDARAQYLRGEYYAASETYRNYYRSLKPNQRAMRGVVAYEMAETYKHLNNPSRASNAYANAIRYNYPDTLMMLSYAQMLHMEGKYQQASDAYRDYLKIDSLSFVAQAGLAGAENALNNKEARSRYIVKQMELFNSNRSEFSPMLAHNDNTIYITSSRNEARGEQVSDVTGVKNNDIFVIEKNNKGEWKRPEILESEINTESDEGVVSVSSDNNYIYYTFSPISYDEPTATKIYYSRRSGSGGWNAGKEFVISAKDSLSLFAHPSISAGGEWLYFVSDMPGGYGGKDIWRAYMVDNSVVSVQNMGPQINTPGDEMFPYIKNDTTLYFSSNGHPGYGGLDIFEAVYDKSRDYWWVQNMKAPINSSMDDFGITFEKDKTKGFFSSNRNDVRGRDHIYSFELPDVQIRVEGFAVDDNDEFLDSVLVSVIGNDGFQREFTTKKDGTYGFDASANVDYIFLASRDGYLNEKRELNVTKVDDDTTYYIDFEMTPYERPVVLENIFYDFDRATLRSESKLGLDGLVEILNNNPNIAIELSAHTDRKGTQEYNEELSQRRAQAVVDYLIANGINPKRLTAAGYGKLQPKEVTKQIAESFDFLNIGDILSEEFVGKLTEEQQKEADQINRRTEFKVTDHKFGLY